MEAAAAVKSEASVALPRSAEAHSQPQCGPDSGRAEAGSATGGGTLMKLWHLRFSISEKNICANVSTTSCMCASFMMVGGARCTSGESAFDESRTSAGSTGGGGVSMQLLTASSMYCITGGALATPIQTEKPTSAVAIDTTTAAIARKSLEQRTASSVLAAARHVSQKVARKTSVPMAPLYAWSVLKTSMSAAARRRDVEMFASSVV
mmetsp:Transcript_47684/g.101837  ORF Transcript_47684/g.101837 Transcript_47684/m.101837 type:complete len:207 (-) Transcript_47684:160-780(-)